jgi:PhzF family phenazine biosynthesis protein
MLEYHHVDVFSAEPYAGNSLAVFVDQSPLSPDQMLAVTRELRHFESIFVSRTSVDSVQARVFDLFEELPFAGHPTLGAAAVLHHLTDLTEGSPVTWHVHLAARTVRITTSRIDGRTIAAELEQGAPEVLPPHPLPDPDEVALALGLERVDLHPVLPMQVVSTGLRYLIVPVVTDALARAHYTRPDMDRFLDQHGADFCYVLDADRLEGRHWNNDGGTEDIATGSAAGCVAAYLLQQSRVASGQTVDLRQGRYTGRPSRMQITAFGTADRVENVTVGGEVSILGTGRLFTVPVPVPAVQS